MAAKVVYEILPRRGWAKAAHIEEGAVVNELGVFGFERVHKTGYRVTFVDNGTDATIADVDRKVGWIAEQLAELMFDRVAGETL